MVPSCRADPKRVPNEAPVRVSVSLSLWWTLTPYQDKIIRLMSLEDKINFSKNVITL